MCIKDLNQLIEVNKTESRGSIKITIICTK